MRAFLIHEAWNEGLLFATEDEAIDHMRAAWERDGGTPEAFNAAWESGELEDWCLFLVRDEPQ